MKLINVYRMSHYILPFYMILEAFKASIIMNIEFLMLVKLQDKYRQGYSLIVENKLGILPVVIVRHMCYLTCNCLPFLCVEMRL